jgi:hypothetical protein
VLWSAVLAIPGRSLPDITGEIVHIDGATENRQATVAETLG